MRPITFISTLFICLNLLPGTASAEGGGGWTWPIRGPVITAYKNGSDPYASGQHRGVDIGAFAGTPVVAATGGTVTFVGVVGSSGLTVAERTGDGRLDLSYLHLGSASVHRGDVLATGGALGSVGTSGRRSAEAPHLHFGVREAGSHTAYRDPLDFLPPVPPNQAPEPSPSPVPVGEPAVPHPATAAQAGAPAPAAPSPVGTPVPSSGAPALAPPPLPWPLTPPVDHAHTPRTAPGTVTARPSELLLRWEHAGAAHPSGLMSAHHAGSPPTEHASSRTLEARHGDGGSPAPRGPAAPEATDGHSAGAARHRAPGGSPHDLHLGWLAACLGLVAAATALGHPDGTRRLATRGRARMNALLGPAVRRG